MDTVNYLANKYNICYITARPREAKMVTIQWLRRYKFPNNENLYFSEDKTIDLRTNNCTYFIEDHWKQEVIDRLNKVTNVILVDRLYNKHITGVPRIKELKELKTLL
jgi:uncharacterized HAD superfamily protein